MSIQIGDLVAVRDRAKFPWGAGLAMLVTMPSPHTPGWRVEHPNLAQGFAWMEEVDLVKVAHVPPGPTPSPPAGGGHAWTPNHVLAAWECSNCGMMLSLIHASWVALPPCVGTRPGMLPPTNLPGSTRPTDPAPPPAPLPKPKCKHCRDHYTGNFSRCQYCNRPKETHR